MEVEVEVEEAEEAVAAADTPTKCKPLRDTLREVLPSNAWAVISMQVAISGNQSSAWAESGACN